MKNNQKSFISIILIGVIVILLGVGGYFIWSKKSNKVNNPEQLPLATSQTGTSKGNKSVPKSFCTDIEFSENITKDLPKDIEPMVYRILQCNHWGGEEGYDQERINEINKAYEENKCFTIEKDQSDFLNKYSGNEKVINAIKSANSWGEGSCN